MREETGHRPARHPKLPHASFLGPGLFFYKQDAMVRTTLVIWPGKRWVLIGVGADDLLYYCCSAVDNHRLASTSVLPTPLFLYKKGGA